MMHKFLANNRDALIKRCRGKVAQRPKREATKAQLANGIPIFLDQLITTLKAENVGDSAASLRISGAEGGDSAALSELGVSAGAHGKQLLDLGYTVDQVVHDYGDLCQAITDMAFERDAPFEVDEFRTLNRCLDNAIADAVTEFSYERDVKLNKVRLEAMNDWLGFEMLELRQRLSNVHLAVRAMEHGSLLMSGATGALLKRNLDSLTRLVDNTLEGGSRDRDAKEELATFSAASLISDAQDAAALDIFKAQKVANRAHHNILEKGPEPTPGPNSEPNAAINDEPYDINPADWDALFNAVTERLLACVGPTKLDGIPALGEEHALGRTSSFQETVRECVESMNRLNAALPRDWHPSKQSQ
jgi:hypothetical protein